MRESITVLSPGVRVRGRVLGPDGEPIQAARVLIGDSRFDANKREGASLETGEFVVPNCPPGVSKLAV